MPLLLHPELRLSLAAICSPLPGHSTGRAEARCQRPADSSAGEICWPALNRCAKLEALINQLMVIELEVLILVQCVAKLNGVGVKIAEIKAGADHHNFEISRPAS